MSGWHVDADLLRRWVDGAAGPTVAVSVEQHVLRCADCRAEVAGHVPTVSAAVALRLEWLAGVIVVLSFAVIAAILGPVGGIALFLVAAPLLPVAGVAVAYGPSADPLYELVLAAPYAMVRLVLLRTATVLATSAPLTVVAGLLLPASPTVAVAWLLPAAGFVAVVLTASIWVDPMLAAGAVAVGWVAAVITATRYDDPVAVFAPAALVGYLGLTVVAALILVPRLFGAVPSWRLR
jgi:hypothetical protein